MLPMLRTNDGKHETIKCFSLDVSCSCFCLLIGFLLVLFSLAAHKCLWCVLSCFFLLQVLQFENIPTFHLQGSVSLPQVRHQTEIHSAGVWTLSLSGCLCICCPLTVSEAPLSAPLLQKRRPLKSITPVFSLRNKTNRLLMCWSLYTTHRCRQQVISTEER